MSFLFRSTEEDKQDENTQLQDDVAKQGLSLLMSNQFEAARLYFNQYIEIDPRCALFQCMLSYVSALSSYHDTDLNGALDQAWRAEKLGGRLASSTNPSLSIMGKLVQADSHLMGANVQLVQQSFVKGCWNIRKSWNFYSAAMKELEAHPDVPNRHDLMGWAQFGLGFFNLFVSLLPPAVLRIAEWIGFGGNREYGLESLHQAHQSPSLMSPFASLVLLLHYVSIAQFTGDDDSQNLIIADRILSEARSRYPDAVFFTFMESRLWRCRGQLDKAIQASNLAVPLTQELPSLSQVCYYQTGWCAFFRQDWNLTIEQMDLLLYSKDADGNRIEKPATRGSVQALYGYHVGLCYAVQGKWEQAVSCFSRVRHMITKHSRPLEHYAARKAAIYETRHKDGHMLRVEDAVLDAMEMIRAWNGFTQMSPSDLQNARTLMESTSESDMKSSEKERWNKDDRARYTLTLSCLLRALGETQHAHDLLQSLIDQMHDLEQSPASKQAGTPSMVYIERAHVLLKQGEYEQAKEWVKKATHAKGYDLFNFVQFRAHAINHQLSKHEKHKHDKTAPSHTHESQPHDHTHESAVDAVHSPS